MRAMTGICAHWTNSFFNAHCYLCEFWSSSLGLAFLIWWWATAAGLEPTNCWTVAEESHLLCQACRGLFEAHYKLSPMSYYFHFANFCYLVHGDYSMLVCEFIMLWLWTWMVVLTRPRLTEPSRSAIPNLWATAPWWAVKVVKMGC